MATLFIILTVLSAMGTIGLLIVASLLNQVLYIVLAIIAGLFTWLFWYIVDNTDLF